MKPPSQPSVSMAGVDDDDDSASPESSNYFLPPGTTTESTQYLDGATPNVLSDVVLGLHTHSHSKTKRGHVVFGRDDVTAPLLQSVGEDHEGGPSTEEDDDDNDADEDRDGPSTGGRPRTSRSRSKSMLRKKKWYERPGPAWLLPGTLLLALSIGMIISPKMEIYTQLVCRSLPPPRSNSPVGPPLTRGPTASQFAFDDNDLSSSSKSEMHSPFVSFLPFNSIPPPQEQPMRTPEEEEKWARECRHRPDVQKAVVPLSTIITLSSGLLSAFTTGYWGALSDRRGRKPIMALSLLGMLIMDAIFLISVNFYHIVGYRFLFVGPAIDGCLGGISTAQASILAYLSDCSDPGSRARLFSVFGGILFGGIALGPTVGSLVISMSTSPNAVLLPFYIALAMHALYLVAVIFIVPESLSDTRQEKARQRWIEEKTSRGSWRPWSFLRPLGLLLPSKIANGGGPGDDESEPILVANDDLPILWWSKADGGSDVTEEEKRSRRWTLLKVALSYAFYSLVISIGAMKMQYTQLVYGWDAVANGYLLSLAGTGRMLVLVVILPGFIWLFRSPPPTPGWEKPVSVTTLVTTAADAASTNAQSVGQQADGVTATTTTPAEHHVLLKKWENEQKYLKVLHDSRYGIMIFPRMTPEVFVAATGIQSFGGGGGPAIQSLALAHTAPRDSGRLFASLSVVSALCSSVIGPSAFGIVYYSTIKFWPEAMFAVAAFCYGLALFFLLLINLGEGDGRWEEEERKRRRKRLLMGYGTMSGRDEYVRRGRSVTRKPGTLSSEILLRD